MTAVGAKVVFDTNILISAFFGKDRHIAAFSPRKRSSSC
jgi:predicted nucleic acid-binding protein